MYFHIRPKERTLLRGVVIDASQNYRKKYMFKYSLGLEIRKPFEVEKGCQENQQGNQ